MPAYTFGLLAPVPFWYLALGYRRRSLTFITAGYTALWLTAWVLAIVSGDNGPGSNVAGFLFFGTGAACAIHAFVLRSTLPAGEGPFEAVVPPAHGPSTDTETWQALQIELVSLKSYVAKHADSLPSDCKGLIDQILAQLDEMITFAAGGGIADAQLRPVQAVVTDYLPTSLRTYLRLPSDYALHQRNPDGRTAAGELAFQLQLLLDSAKETAVSLYQGDSLRLQEQSTFLESKFGKSELDLP